MRRSPGGRSGTRHTKCWRAERCFAWALDTDGCRGRTGCARRALRHLPGVGVEHPLAPVLGNAQECRVLKVPVRVVGGEEQHVTRADVLDEPTFFWETHALLCETGMA